MNEPKGEKPIGMGPNAAHRLNKGEMQSAEVGLVRGQVKNEKEQINNKLMESWINDFLVEAENKNVPATLLRSEGKSAMAR